MKIEQESNICFGGVDQKFIEKSAFMIALDIAFSASIAGVALTSLVLLRVFWKKDENFKRHAYSFGESFTAVRYLFQMFL